MGGRRVRRAAGGFTLIELLVVLLIVAVASGAATLALRDGDQMRLDREAERLAAVLESARAQSRASGLPVRWQATSDGQGFHFLGLPHARLSHPWLEPTLVLRGENTYPFAARAVERWTRSNPVARREVLPGGHCFMQEDPDRAAGAVSAYLLATD